MLARCSHIIKRTRHVARIDTTQYQGVRMQHGETQTDALEFHTYKPEYISNGEGCIMNAFLN